MKAEQWRAEILCGGPELLLGDIVNTNARELGTYETSILPYEDCCTVFTPRHPRTRPTPAEVEEAEAALDVEALIKEALAGTERVQIKHES